jgi:hypothetical protein
MTGKHEGGRALIYGNMTIDDGGIDEDDVDLRQDGVSVGIRTRHLPNTSHITDSSHLAVE